MAITTKHQLLAWDLVEGLNDEKHKGIYFRLAKVYNEAFLREILSRVKDAYNQRKIKSEDRGRYFMGILKKEYGKNTKNSSRRRSGLKKKGRADKKSKKS
jgi:hypothetical protein